MRTVGDPRSTALPRLVFGIGAACLALAGCAELEVGAEAVKAVNRSINEANRAPQTPVTRTAAGSQINPDLQPAPEEFEARGLVIWDGVRTLQGVWVAHPKAETARRVRIIDTTTRRAVDGALFRRDEALSGSSILISSEAATLLELRPGEKSELLIVALKPGAAPVETAAVAEAESEAATAPEAQPETDPDVELAALPPPTGSDTDAPDLADDDAPNDTEVEAEAEPEAVETAEANAPAEEAEVELAADTDPDGETQVDTEEEAAPEPVPEPAGAADAEIALAEAEEAAPQAETTANEPASEPETAQIPPEKPEPPAADATDPDVDTEAEAEAEATEIALAEPQANAPEDEPTENPEFNWQQPAAAAPEAETEAQPAEPAPVPTRRAGPGLYVVAGTFGVRDNAVRLVKRIEDAGFPSAGQSVSGGRLTQVIAGPFADSDAQSDALAKIRAMGLPDAIAIKN